MPLHHVFNTTRSIQQRAIVRNSPLSLSHHLKPTHAIMASSSANRDTPKMHAPAGNDNVLQKVGAPLAAISSHADPWPHYTMSAACECLLQLPTTLGEGAIVLTVPPSPLSAGAASALYSYSSLNSPCMAGIKAALGLAYMFAGRQLVTGNPRLGYDLGSVTSLALVSRGGGEQLRLCGDFTTSTSVQELPAKKPRRLKQQRLLEEAGSQSARTCCTAVSPTQVVRQVVLPLSPQLKQRESCQPTNSPVCCISAASLQVLRVPSRCCCCSLLLLAATAGGCCCSCMQFGQQAHGPSQALKQ
jgi:hypothetical protein